MIDNILVVCTANICRSPVARLFIRQALRGAAVNVDSAGTLAIDGSPADPIMQALLVERGFTELREHRSRAVMPHHLSHYQLILCMENAHIAHLRRISSVATGKTMLLGRWNNSQEIDDPTGETIKDYVSAVEQIETFCQQWATKMTMMGLVE